MLHFHPLKHLLYLMLFFVFSKTSGQSTAIYDFTFTSIWNASDHTSIPDNAHWSDLVGATHNTTNEFLEIGQLASNGIKDVAELGSNANFQSEVNNAIVSNRANIWLQQDFSPHAAISSASLTDIQLSEDYPLITLVSMVAPSPDWFIMINSLNLRNIDNTAWKHSFSMDVFAYDAGTDDGTDYTSDNMVSNPPVGIFKITGTPFNGNVIGTLTVTLKSVLGLHENVMGNISIYPNPSHGILFISNPNKVTLKTIEIYNVIGKLIKQIKITRHTTSNGIELSHFKKGLYILKLNGEDGHSKTQKLVLQ